MNIIVKSFAVGAIALATVACASQKKQASTDKQSAPRQQAGSQQGGRQQGGPPSFSQLLTEMDANKDGKLAKSEVKGPLIDNFSKIDADNDAFLTEAELKNAPRPQRNGPGK
ncbi:MAG: hypothetical protein RIB71_19290 [Imperialibacter sp.]|uniref:hypothetical protein n=1 Tax=Imperialibacter sp. TaxID=2038411 RepID=UPI0032EE0B07